MKENFSLQDLTDKLKRINFNYNADQDTGFVTKTDIQNKFKDIDFGTCLFDSFYNAFKGERIDEPIVFDKNVLYDMIRDYKRKCNGYYGLFGDPHHVYSYIREYTSDWDCGRIDLEQTKTIDNPKILIVGNGAYEGSEDPEKDGHAVAILSINAKTKDMLLFDSNPTSEESVNFFGKHDNKFKINLEKDLINKDINYNFVFNKHGI